MDKSLHKRILGIDPGTNVLGYAVIEIRGKKIETLEIGVVKLSHLASHQLKLKKIFERLHQIIRQYRPHEMAIEAPFFGKNVQSMLKLGRAQGVAIAAAVTYEVPITEYAPKKIKVAITGNGNASKEQVAAMLQSILKVELKSSSLDATDALAAALCHHFQGGSNGKQRKFSSWKSFANANSDRIRKPKSLKPRSSTKKTT